MVHFNILLPFSFFKKKSQKFCVQIKIIFLTLFVSRLDSHTKFFLSGSEAQIASKKDGGAFCWQLAFFYQIFDTIKKYFNISGFCRACTVRTSLFRPETRKTGRCAPLPAHRSFEYSIPYRNREKSQHRGLSFHWAPSLWNIMSPPPHRSFADPSGEWSIEKIPRNIPVWEKQ